jgi:hypothetical protein
VVIHNFDSDRVALACKTCKLCCTVNQKYSCNSNKLCYTRGTAIPCVMVVETPDKQALDLLSSPRAVVVRLQRRVTYNASTATNHTHAKGTGYQAAVEYLATAVFWPGPACDGSASRRLDGEIQLSKNLKPSSALMHFSITVRDFLLSILIAPLSLLSCGVVPCHGIPIRGDRLQLCRQRSSFNGKGGYWDIVRSRTEGQSIFPSHIS